MSVLPRRLAQDFVRRALKISVPKALGAFSWFLGARQPTGVRGGSCIRAAQIISAGSKRRGASRRSKHTSVAKDETPGAEIRVSFVPLSWHAGNITGNCQYLRVQLLHAGGPMVPQSSGTQRSKMCPKILRLCKG